MNSRAERVIRAAKAMGIRRVKASPQDIQSKIKGIQSQVKILMDKGYQNNKPARQVYDASDIQRIEQQIRSLIPVIEQVMQGDSSDPHSPNARKWLIVNQLTRAAEACSETLTQLPRSSAMVLKKNGLFSIWSRLDSASHNMINLVESNSWTFPPSNRR